MFSLSLRLNFVMTLVFAALSAGFIVTCSPQTEPVTAQNVIDNSLKERTQLFESGKQAYQKEDYEKALPLLKKGLQLAESAREPLEQAHILNLIGLVHSKRSQMQQAMDYYKRALLLYQSYTGSDANIARSAQANSAGVLNNLGNAAHKSGLFQEELKYQSEALKIREDIGDKFKIAESYNGLGMACEDLKQYNKAMDYYQRSLVLCESLSDQQGIAFACDNMGNVNEELGEYEKALTLHLRAIEAATKFGDPSSIASVMNNLANTYEELGQLDQAYKLQQDSLLIMEKHGSPQEIANALHNLGNISADQGRFDQALDYLFKALALRKKSGSRQEIAVSLLNIGTVYDSLGRLQDAQKLYEEARAIVEKCGDVEIQANCALNLANIAARGKRYSDAFALVNKSLALRKKFASPQDVAQCWTNMGAMYEMRRQGTDDDKALECYNQALPVIEKSRNPQLRALLLDDIGTVYQHKMNYEQAINYHKRALELRRSIANLQDVMLSLTNLGGAYQHLFRLEDAESCYQEAEKAFEKIGEQVGDPSRYGTYQQTISNFYAHYASLKAARYHVPDALLTVERGRARGLALQAAQNAAVLESRLSPDDLAKKRSLEQALLYTRARFNQIQHTQPFGDPDEEKARQFRLRAAQRHFTAAESNWQAWRDTFYVNHIEYRNISGHAQPDAQVLMTLARQNPDTLYLEWQVVDENQLLLFTLSTAGIQVFRIMIQAGDLERLIDSWLSDIEAARTGGTDGAMHLAREEMEAKTLYRLLFATVIKSGLFNVKSCKRLVFVADGVLLRIPFSALMASDGKRLVECYSLSTAISLGSLTWPTEKRSSRESLLCIADPLGSGAKFVSRARGEFGGLAGARKEGIALKDLLPETNLLLGAKARKELVKREMPKYTILHFATHGTLDSAHPLYSGLILAAEPTNSGEYGILEAYEIAGMRLSADLAVLSACQTARGQISGGEGLIGLTWAFRAAGCPAVAASQWEINDTSTAILIRSFYHELLKGQRKDDALRAAMRTVMIDKTHRSPYYWAAFQIIGDSSPLRLPLSTINEKRN